MLNSIDLFINQHPYYAMGILMVIANAISAMPTPTDQSGAVYKWAWTFLHSINIPRLLTTFNPAMATKMGIMTGETPQDTPLQMNKPEEK